MASQKISYKEAIQEIERILYQIENEDLDVDELAGKVKRAYLLLSVCKKKLYSTEQDIENIMKEFDAGSNTGSGNE
jgi:exodeoxyribonuclease VII small subunit